MTDYGKAFGVNHSTFIRNGCRSAVSRDSSTKTTSWFCAVMEVVGVPTRRTVGVAVRTTVYQAVDRIICGDGDLSER